jgi:hypothetical protein
MKKILVLLFILASLVPIFYLNKWLQSLIVPRQSLARLAIYIFVVLELVFIYTYLLVIIIARLFPLEN